MFVSFSPEKKKRNDSNQVRKFRHERRHFVAASRRNRLVERVKGDWGPVKVRNANKPSIVFECDIMSRSSFSRGHTRKKNPRCGVAISSFKKKRDALVLDLSPSSKIYLKL